MFFCRVASDAVYENVDLEELMLQLREAENLEEQGDILHYLVGASRQEGRNGGQMMMVMIVESMVMI